MKSVIVRLLRFALLGASLGSAVAACDAETPDDGGADGAGGEGSGVQYVTSTIVWNAEGEDTYVTLLGDLDVDEVLLDDSIEFPGWSSVFTSGGKLLVSSGEAPRITRYSVESPTEISELETLEFLGAGYADSEFVSETKAYVFEEDAIVWNPDEMVIEGRFELPVEDDRADDMLFSGLYEGRAVAISGNRMYVTAHWANWDDYRVSEDSLIVVIDTDEDRVIKTIPVDCPYFDFTSVDDDGTVYFSNWVYSVPQTLLEGKRKACSVRILPGQDDVDPSWSLEFASVTEGREGAALYAIGGGKAVFSVFYDELAETGGDIDMSTYADGAYWRFWLLDLEDLAAAPVDGIDFFAGGFGASRVNGETFVLLPSSSYESTTVYSIDTDGAAIQRWTTPGWSTEVLSLD